MSNNPKIAPNSSPDQEKPDLSPTQLFRIGMDGLMKQFGNQVPIEDIIGTLEKTLEICRFNLQLHLSQQHMRAQQKSASKIITPDKGRGIL